MIKRFFIFIAAVVVAFLASYFPHHLIIQAKEINLSFSLLSVYVFYVIAALLVYAIVEFIAEKMPNQAGYAYLASIFLKIGFFVLIFKSSVFSNDALSKIERISLIVPLFLFLILEAVFISKLLNNK